MARNGLSLRRRRELDFIRFIVMLINCVVVLHLLWYTVKNSLRDSQYLTLDKRTRRPPSVGELQAPGTDEAYLEALPEGFVDRTTNIGKIIGWAPQVDVLAHPAIGGFVSHCGWNSVLESMRFGVPIGAWPMYAEQNLNAFELVEELKLAVEIRLDYVMNWSSGKGNFIVSATNIVEGLKKLMSMDENMKKNVKDMGDQGRKALEDGGSSSHWLDRFINDVTST